MGQCYGQLSLEERVEIYRLHAGGRSQNEIASALDRAPSTISRELRRNSRPTKVWNGGYEPVRAQQLAERRRRWDGRFKLARQTDLRNCVGESLAMGHSPEQIAGRLALEHGRVIISHESIYRFIYHRAAQKDCWHRLLPRHKRRRGRRRRPGGSPAGFIKQRRSITERPIEVEGRGTPGHWEADFMLFARCGQGLLVLHERKTRFSIVHHPVDRKAVLTARTIARQLGKLPKAIRKTISFDNGNEFAEHHRLHKPSASKLSSAIPIVLGKKAEWKTPSGVCDARCPAKLTSTSSRQPLSSGTFSASTTPHGNAWTSRHPPRHSPNSNQSLHFKRDSIPRMRGV
jgi:IS30 family transposase